MERLIPNRWWPGSVVMGVSAGCRVTKPKDKASLICRPWTDEEESTLCKWWGKRTAAEIGEMVGRTASAVYQRAKRLGVSSPRDKEAILERRKEIKRLHKLGWSDQEVANALGVSRETIGGSRNRMGIKPNGHNERFREKASERTKRQLAQSGVNSLAELRSKRFAETATKYGWPDHLSLRSVQIAEILYQRGPMTRRQIADAIGIKWRGSRRTLGNRRVPGSGYLAELQRAGLVVQLPRAVSLPGSGYSQSIYMLGLGVEPCRKSRRALRSMRSKEASSRSLT